MVRGENNVALYRNIAFLDNFIVFLLSILIYDLFVMSIVDNNIFSYCYGFYGHHSKKNLREGNQLL